MKLYASEIPRDLSQAAENCGVYTRRRLAARQLYDVRTYAALQRRQHGCVRLRFDLVYCEISVPVATRTDVTITIGCTLSCAPENGGQRHGTRGARFTSTIIN